MLRLRKMKGVRPHQFCAAPAAQNRRWGLFAISGIWNLRKANKAQTIAEYVITLALVVAVFVAMSVFVKRALQGRIRDARNYMVKTANDTYGAMRSGGNEDTPASIPYEYEPYYIKQDSDVRRQTDDKINLRIGGIPGEASGVFNRVFNQATTVNAQSEQLPPKDAY